MKETTLTFSAPGQTQCIWLYAFLDVNNDDAERENFDLRVNGVSGDYSNQNINVLITILDVGEKCMCVQNSIFSLTAYIILLVPNLVKQTNWG